jgi:two-component system response regulator HydG
MTAGNREQTAQMLGIGERTLYRKLKEYGLR